MNLPPAFAFDVEVAGPELPGFAWLVVSGEVDGQAVSARYSYLQGHDEAREVAVEYLTAWAWARLRGGPPVEVPDERPRRGSGRVLN